MNRRGGAMLISRSQFTAFSNSCGVIKMLCPFGLLQTFLGKINLHALKRPGAEHIGSAKKQRVRDLP
jgi:hypothetical protein